MNKTVYLRIMFFILSCVQNIFYKINDNNNGSYSNKVQNIRMEKIEIHGVLCICYENLRDPMRWNVCFCTIKIFL